MRVLLAFDKFKDSLSAAEACRLASETLRSAQPDWILDSAPLTDGGDGFVSILTTAAGGSLVEIHVAGPYGEPRTAQLGLISWGRIPAAARERLALASLRDSDTVAIVEMAACSGLALVPPERRDPWRTTSYGTGQALAAAFANGARAILLGVGGSATHDLGLGALAALGLHGREVHGTELFPPVPAVWEHLVAFAGHVPAAFPPLRIACDVANPLLGPTGAAATFAPQKGLRPADLSRLESATARVAALLVAHCVQPPALATLPGAGAAGGIAFGLMAAARAQLVPGCALVHDWLDLDSRIAASDLGSPAKAVSTPPRSPAKARAHSRSPPPRPANAFSFSPVHSANSPPARCREASKSTPSPRRICRSPRPCAARQNSSSPRYNSTSRSFRHHRRRILSECARGRASTNS